MEDNKKRKLNLKIKTFSDFKRFTSKTLHKIVEKMRGKNDLTLNQIAKNRIAANEGKTLEEGRRGSISIEELTNRDNMIALLKHAARKSLIDRADRMDEKQAQKINEKYNNKKEILDNLLEEEKITVAQYNKAIEKLEYKTTKKIYEKDLSSGVTEKPKNPTIQRAIENVGKAAKTVGKGIATAAKVSAGIVALPFVGLYQGAKFVGKKALALGRGGKVAALTAGKVVSNTAKTVAENVKGQVEPIASQIKETEESRRNSKNAKTFEEKAEIYENANKETQEAIYEDDYKAALKENAKREREAARREKLHMNAEQQPIDHEEAKKHTLERAEAQELSPEEVKEVYGEEK